MKASPLLLILNALIELIEERLRSDAGASTSDLVLVGKQLHRLNGLYIRLVETTVEPHGLDATDRF